MLNEHRQDDSDTPEERDDRNPESGLDVAAAVEYGEKFEACQVTAYKVQAARQLIALAGGYKEAMILTDAVWFASRHEAASGNSDADEDGPECECMPDCEAWLARTRRVMAAETLLRLASGYEEAFVLLDSIEVAVRGSEGYQQVLKIRNAAAGYHARVAAALKRNGE